MTTINLPNGGLILNSPTNPTLTTNGKTVVNSDIDVTGTCHATNIWTPFIKNGSPIQFQDQIYGPGIPTVVDSSGNPFSNGVIIKLNADYTINSIIPRTATF